MKNNNDNNINHINDAMSHIDDDLLDSALLMRRKLQQNQPVKNPARALRRMAVLAVCLAVVMTATVIAVVAAPADEPAETTAAATTELTGEIIIYPLPPDFLTLDEIYEIEPFSFYFPRSGFDNLTLETCSRYTREWHEKNVTDSDLGYRPQEYGESLQVEFIDTPEYSLMIYMSKDWVDPYRSQHHYTPYDPTDVESYECAKHEDSYYISDEVRAQRRDKVFLPQDVSLEVIKNLYHDTTLFESESNLRSYWTEGYRYSFEITILFEDDYTISYEYYGDDITPEMMYEMIMSAEYFNA